MRILIGTPIHQVKDYAMERWLKNVAELRAVYAADLLMVDNSPDPSYMEKIKEYSTKYNLRDYKLIHIDLDPSSILDEKLARSREVIRQEVLSKNYDAWFSWECDIIIPIDILKKLIGLAKSHLMIAQAYPSRSNSKEFNAELGLTLVRREILKEFSFLNNYGHVDALQPNCAYGGDVWFCVWVRRKYGRKYTHAYKITKPIYHLGE